MRPVDQSKKVLNLHEGQFEYLGRWVDKVGFRAFVYNSKEEQKLANSYEEFKALTGNGIWFSSQADALKKRKFKDVIASSNSE